MQFLVKNQLAMWSDTSSFNLPGQDCPPLQRGETLLSGCQWILSFPEGMSSQDRGTVTAKIRLQLLASARCRSHAYRSS